MFKEISVKQSENLAFDLGQIAECLFFYEKVNFVCSIVFFKKLIEENKIHSFLGLTEFPALNIHLEETVLAFHQSDINGITDKLARFLIVRGGANATLEIRLERVIYDLTRRSGYSGRLTKKILAASNIIEHPDNITAYMLDDLKDDVYTKRLISNSVNHYCSEDAIEPETVKYEAKFIDGGVVLFTNLDLEKINSHNPNNLFDNLTILGNLANSRTDIMLASQFNSDLLTSPLNSAIIKSKINTIMEKSTNNVGQINSFQEIHLPEGKAIAQAINSGHRSLRELYDILEKADKFKLWLKEIDDDSSLLKEYNEAVTKQTWINELPGKSFRWSFFTGAGLVIDALGAGGLGTLAGIGISAGDTFLLDKISKGWRPDSFINKDLQKFLK